MKKIKILTISFVSIFAFLLPSVALSANFVANAQADIDKSLCAGTSLEAPVGGATPDCTVNKQESSEKVNEIVALVINIFSWIVGVVAVIMIIYGGFQYITAAGNESKVSGAKNTILYALIGLVIVALSQIIVKFVLGSVTGE